jgi:hypothetical protein
MTTYLEIFEVIGLFGRKVLGSYKKLRLLLRLKQYFSLANRQVEKYFRNSWFKDEELKKSVV